jgi:carbamoyltransferase
MIRWGITANSHDASLAVFDNTELLFAAHSERSSGIKNDARLNTTLIEQALAWGEPGEVHWYETQWLKRLRQMRAGQWNTAIHKPSPRATLARWGLVTSQDVDDLSVPLVDKYTIIDFFEHRHHASHAAAGWYTSPYDTGAVLVIDSIGEWETLTMWTGSGDNLVKRFSQSYPHSVGLWYSAMTQRCGLKPNEEEYILMGMAAVGDPERFADRIFNDFFYPLASGSLRIKFKHNLHRGCLWWEPELRTMQDIADIAAGTQAVYERIFRHLVYTTRLLTGEENIVLMGGCALNCVANNIAYDYFKQVWIMPNPGDAGSSVGCVLDELQTKIEFKSPYLGYNIEGTYPVNAALYELYHGEGLVGVANGRAEYGPRALGNRSLFADPRGPEMKDKVNAVKRRQEFRPFAPVIKEEKLHEYFEMPGGCVSSPYMQFVGRCRYPDLYPAITHLDGTSRVQTVTPEQHPGLYELLDKWEQLTGCPMLLNTSLNIKGEPMVDTQQDADRWYEKYGVPVVMREL